MDARATLGQLGDTDPDYRIAARTAPPGLLRLYFEANPDLIRQSTPNTLAVLDLRNHSMTEHASMEPVGQGLAEVLIARLSGDSALTVVERERLDYVLQEIALPDSLLDNATAVRAGRLLGAQNLLLGGFTRIKDRLRIDARLVRTETGEVLRTGSVEGKLDDVFALVEDLAEKMIPELAAAMGERSQADTEFLGFYEYALGLEALDTEDLSGAREHFERALAHAPDMKMAAERLDQLAPILASGGHE
jgi:TolB-like protein